ncbi:hypothetical protein H483_0102265 [Dietzia sp. UCD-THP]|uniref:hypothetical protein n=1 Tax=Dietzia sp. UCD-THP TaxID=1292020 RepID=UPI00036B0399|nr:hypothetical protein [Dietzia sp. UCD-THP]EYT65059.1 hypothetical protein H483_0102265 [Dietzia sp. UCD-THP]
MTTSSGEQGRGSHDAVPARPSWQRPPFEKGNTLSRTHGAWSDRAVSPVAERYLVTAVESVDYLQDPSYLPALSAWARTEARIELLEAWLDEHGMVDDETGQVRGAANLLARFEAQAAKQRERLGMDPLSRAKIRQMTASTQVDLAQLMAQAVQHDQD